MPDKQQRECVLGRLRALVDAIEDECARNPEFLSRIEAVLNLTGAIQPTKKAGGSATKTPPINVLEILHHQGEEAAKGSLNALTNDDLAKLAVADGIKKLKEARAMERDALISLCLETAWNRLRQGESFTKG